MKKIILATALLFISTISFAQEKTAEQISIGLSNTLCKQDMKYMAERIAMNIRHSSETSRDYTADTKRAMEVAFNSCGSSCYEVVDNLAMEAMKSKNILNPNIVTEYINICDK